jgi:hypothetical protein
MARSTQVPVTTDTDPKVAALIDRGNELSAQERQLERDFLAVESRIVAKNSSSGVEQAARDLLADGVASLSGVVDLHEQREVLGSRLRVIRKALEIHGKELRQARVESGRRIAEARRPEYAAVVRKMKGPVEALQAAMAEESALRDSLCQADALGCGVIQTVSLDAAEWVLTNWLMEAKQHYGI